MFDVILLFINDSESTPDIEGIDQIKIPVVSGIGDPQENLPREEFHKKWKINAYFNWLQKEFFYKYYPKHFRYTQIFLGLEPQLFENITPFNQRIKDKILNSGAVGNTKILSRLSNFIRNPNHNALNYYKLRTLCNKLSYVDYTPTLQHEFIRDKYTLLLQKYRASIAASTFFLVVKYFEMPLAASWERTYGWAWVLKLDEELLNWNDAEGKRWHEALEPLTKKIIDIWKKFLPKQTYPNRTGVHPNTAFGLVFALDYARMRKDTSFERAITGSARQIFGKDKNAPALWEPNGADFLSPSLEEADLMRRILSAKEFLNWFNLFMPLQSLKHLTVLPVVSDRTDLQIVHLDGLSFSRSWCMRGIASALPTGDPRKKLLLKSSVNHLSVALPNVVSGHYGGEHWLASFAVYALLN